MGLEELQPNIPEQFLIWDVGGFPCMTLLAPDSSTTLTWPFQNILSTGRCSLTLIPLNGLLYSPASSHLLPVLLLISKRVTEMFVHDGQVAGHHSAGTTLDEAEHLLLIRGVHVVKEDPSYAATLSSVANVEVSVTPGYENNWIAKLLLYE